ncbi:hypothetical protein FB451DRAFT_1559566 [Mycena latifolia]|nr:hypothetical protein FB451DRAFT_1559566 [Mycena latifolia]
MANLQLSFALLLIFGVVLASAAAPVAENDIPITFVGSIAVPQASSGDTRVYYQNANNDIGELAVTGPLVSGHLFNSQVIVPGARVLPGTPIATAVLGDNWAELHIFFVSPTHVLSEWIWNAAAFAWRGVRMARRSHGAAPGSQVLYETANNATTSPALLRVAFISGGAPNTLSEASFTAANGWQLGQLSS